MMLIPLLIVAIAVFAAFILPRIGQMYFQMKKTIGIVFCIVGAIIIRGFDWLPSMYSLLGAALVIFGLWLVITKNTKLDEGGYVGGSGKHDFDDIDGD